MSDAARTCLACGAADVRRFLLLPEVPVFCNIMWDDADGARSAPRGDLDLGICGACGHVFNLAFDIERVKYAENYENSLHHSPRFQSYAEELARDLRERHDVDGGSVVEIACGQGDFLKMVCVDPGTTGIGFDPSYRGEAVAPNVTIRGEYFGARPFGKPADLVCCRHALEHIETPVPFLQGMRGALTESSRAVIFFEVPNSLYSLRDGGVWDFIYEHVSYFCGTSLAACFVRAGLRVTRTWETFGGQFLCLEAAADGEAGSDGADLSPVPGAAELVALAEGLSTQLEELLEHWRKRFAAVRAAGGKVAVWGAGSKGVTFLNLMGADADLCLPVDINPEKRGKHVAGTGHPIVAPADLAGRDVRLVLVMNPVYTEEIAGMVRDLGISAEVVGV
ncbi:methyltransferase domain-containing protein [bacterium]|nr:methyltransferase domain-containing protein [bacterium]